ncbi:MAG: galactokinase, partial [Leptospiraceae bacterium]|nr:galactokinase [Leptospiraceae bacterium]
GGLVLPAAINLHTQLAISRLPEKKWVFHSVQFHETVELSDLIYQQEHKWVNYILGIMLEIQKRGVELPGFQLAISGNIPHGAGLSSSASLEVAVGFALSEILNLGLSRKEIALIGQKAENEFVGMQCGIMDQFVIANGKKDFALLLNTSTLEFEYKNLNLGSCEFYLIDSKVKHNLETSDYNVRRKECEVALEKIRKKLPNLKDLYSLPIDTNLDDFELSTDEKKRVRHVIGEKRRTENVLYYLESGRPD